MFTVIETHGAYELLHYPRNGYCIMTRRPAGDKDGMWESIINGPLKKVLEKWHSLKSIS